jgi:hypothetical protein
MVACLILVRRMSGRHLVALFLCVSVFACLRYVGSAWSLADFHPGSDVHVSAQAHEKARAGALISALFDVPSSWISSGVSNPGFIAFLQWMLLPALYGATCYSLIHVLWRRWRAAHRSV